MPLDNLIEIHYAEHNRGGATRAICGYESMTGRYLVRNEQYVTCPACNSLLPQVRVGSPVVAALCVLIVGLVILFFIGLVGGEW